MEKRPGHRGAGRTLWPRACHTQGMRKHSLEHERKCKHSQGNSAGELQPPLGWWAAGRVDMAGAGRCGRTSTLSPVRVRQL